MCSAPLQKPPDPEVADGYLFLDWFAIPQITARSSGVNEDMTRSDAALAVQSIPAYVEACDPWRATGGGPEEVMIDLTEFPLM